MGFSGQEYWSGLQCPLLGDLPDPGIEPVSHVSCVAGEFFTNCTPWEVQHQHVRMTDAVTHPCFPQGLGERLDAPEPSGATGDGSSHARSCRPVGGEGSLQFLARHFQPRPQTLRRCLSLRHWRWEGSILFSDKPALLSELPLIH